LKLVYRKYDGNDAVGGRCWSAEGLVSSRAFGDDGLANQPHSHTRVKRSSLKSSAFVAGMFANHRRGPWLPHGCYSGPSEQG